MSSTRWVSWVFTRQAPTVSFAAPAPYARPVYEHLCGRGGPRVSATDRPPATAESHERSLRNSTIALGRVSARPLTTQESNLGSVPEVPHCHEPGRVLLLASRWLGPSEPDNRPSAVVMQRSGPGIRGYLTGTYGRVFRALTVSKANY